MLKIYCDICTNEVVAETLNDKFHCEIAVRKVKITLFKKNPGPAVVEGRFNLCKACFDERLKELNK